jgi:hypothetical protein
MTEVEVLRRWQGSTVNPLEKCGVPDALADQLAALDPPAVKILRRNVPATEGIGADPWHGAGNNALYELITVLIEEVRAGRHKKN